MTSCERFERDGLLAIERDDDAGKQWLAHAADCPDCQAEQEIYQRLGAGIAAAAKQLEPQAGWQARVRSEIARRKAANSNLPHATTRPANRWRRPWLLVPAGLAAAALALVFVLPRGSFTDGDGSLTAPTLSIRTIAGSGTYRSQDLKPNDRVELNGGIGNAQVAELRLYFNDAEVVLNCSTEPPCVRRGNSVTAETTFERRGRYQAVVLSSNAPIPIATGALDYDLDQAIEAGAKVELADAFVVR